jgi:hypothetical protein
MILQSFAIFLPAVIAGFGLVHLLWKNDLAPALLMKLFVGIGVGLGITSCLYFLRLLLLPGQGNYLIIQVIFLLLVFLAGVSQKRISINFSIRSWSLSRTGILLGLAAIFIGILVLYYLVIFARVTPHGDYDAQAIWNLRARSIYRSGDNWEFAFSPLINRNFHMDYPLLVPLNVVGAWNTFEEEVLRIPAVLSMLFLFGIAGVIYSLTAYLRSYSHAAIAVIVLLATPSLLLFSTFQTADIPLTYFFVASASLAVLAGNENIQSLFFISGLMAGLSAWTKNEGIPFVVVMILYIIFIHGIRQSRRPLLALFGGMAFPLLTIFLFKIFVSLNNDLFTDNSLFEIISKLFSPARYIQIVTHLTTELMNLGSWPVSIIAILFVYGFIMGIRKSDSPAEKALLIVPLLQFAIYLLIYVITPYDLAWHMNYSMSRLLIQLFPLALISFFLFVNTPESVLNKVK